MKKPLQVQKVFGWTTKNKSQIGDSQMIDFSFFIAYRFAVTRRTGDFEALYRQQSTNFDRRKKVDLTTELPLLVRCF